MMSKQVFKGVCAVAVVGTLGEVGVTTVTAMEAQKQMEPRYKLNLRKQAKQRSGRRPRGKSSLENGKRRAL